MTIRRNDMIDENGKEKTFEHIKVSLIVPFYNTALFLEKCVDSIRSQTHGNIEVLLVDDGSKDGSSTLADQFAIQDSRIRVVHKSNQGVSSARNTGLDMVSGEYVCFADSDDFLENDYVEYLLKMAEENNAEIAITSRMFSTLYSSSQTPVDAPRVYSGEDAAVRLLYYDYPLGVYCKIFRRDFLNRHNVRFMLDVYVGEDFVFNALAFAKAQKVVVGNRKVYCYRRDNASSAMSTFARHKAEMAVKSVEIIRDNLAGLSQKFNGACAFAEWHMHADMYDWMVLAKSKNVHPDLYRRYYKKVRRYSWRALFSPINKKERFRAFVQILHPRLLACLLELRAWRASK